MAPKCFRIKINGNNRQNRNTRVAATKYRINQEIKFIYCKKKTKTKRTIVQDPFRMCKLLEYYVPAYKTTATILQLDQSKCICWL